MAQARPLRTRELATIHTLKRKLGMDDESYRAALVQVVGVSSAGKIPDSSGRQRVIEHFRDLERRMGLADRPRRRHPAGGKRGAEMGFRDIDSPRERKVRMQWLHLFDLKAVDAPTEAAMNKWISRQFSVDSLNWLEAAGEINACIEQLKRWTDRVESTSTDD